MSLKQICEKYFEAFSNKDLVGLEKMFAKNATLRDWEIQAEGIAKILEANQKIFESVKSIYVKPIKSYEDGNTVVSELDIDVNSGEAKLLVVDVIEFDDEKKINAIRAYKG